MPDQVRHDGEGLTRPDQPHRLVAFEQIEQHPRRRADAGNRLVVKHHKCVRVGEAQRGVGVAESDEHDGFARPKERVDEFGLADPLIGLVITVAILFVLKSAARDIYRRLMDSVDPGLVDAVEGLRKSEQ